MAREGHGLASLRHRGERERLLVQAAGGYWWSTWGHAQEGVEPTCIVQSRPMIGGFEWRKAAQPLLPKRTASHSGQ